jgi:hypothetical protein
MKLFFAVALTVAVSVSSFSAYAQTPPTATKAAAPKAAPAMKKSKLHDGCHSRAAQMSGKPCH